MGRSSRAAMAVVVRRSIAAPSGDVWAVISAPGHLASCHPFCAANPVSVWPGPGSLDGVLYHNGRLIERRFDGWHEGLGYDLEVLEEGRPAARVSWRVAPTRQGSTLTIRLTPRFRDRFPLLLRPIVERLIVRPMMRRYLQAVVRGVEWRVTTGQPVRPNQFGAHRWFSPRG